MHMVVVKKQTMFEKRSNTMTVNLILVVLMISATSVSDAAKLFSSSFEFDTEGFVFEDNPFRNTNQANYSSGRHNPGPGYTGNLQVNLGGIDDRTINGMSAGWRRDFTLTNDASVTININYRMTMSEQYDNSEYLETLCSIDGILLRRNSSNDYIERLFGNQLPVTNNTWVRTIAASVKAGSHRLVVGGFNNKKTAMTKISRIYINNIELIFQETATPVKAPVRVPLRAPVTSPNGGSRFSLRINTGSSTNYTDPNGNFWIADAYHGNKGRMYSVCPRAIAGTTNDQIYCTERFFNTKNTPPPHRYTIPVPRAGTYAVQLHFSETFFKTSGRRVFKVWVNGEQVIAALDIASEVGFSTALVVPLQTKIEGTSLVIEFVPIIENPKINGIEVNEIPNSVPVAPPAPVRAPVTVPASAPVRPPIRVPSISPTGFVLRINSGQDKDYVDPNGVIWKADDYFGNNGAIYGLCPLAIAGTTLDELYCKERYFNIWVHSTPFRYDIPIPRTGTYSVRLHFAEIVHKTTGQRVFEVWVNGREVMGALDIVEEVGFATALVIPVITQVERRSLTIEFKAIKENPKIAGIEVIELLDYVPPPTVAPVTAPFNLLINCGGNGFLDSSGVRRWISDQYFIGGNTYADGTFNIGGTADDILYQTERNGEFKYEIPAPTGSYEVVLHFVELYWQEVGQRKFNIKIEGQLVFENVDIVAIAGGKRFEAFTLESPVIVTDGFVSIEITDSVPAKDRPKLSGIEINFLQPHLAHSVANGPYITTDITNSGSASAKVDGTFSHSHGTGLEIVRWTWKEGSNVVGSGPSPNITLPVGEHVVTLTVKDNADNEATDSTTITVNPFGFPAISAIEPSTGSIAGGQTVTIKGSGFTYATSQTKVKFGTIELSGSSITIVDQFTIRVKSPATIIGSPVSVSVQTPLATSNAERYTYLASTPIAFNSDVLTVDIAAPTSAAFGPDGKLYVGTLYGSLARLTLDNTFTKVTETVIAQVAPFRAILGIAFNPLQTQGLSDVYITTSFFFHGESKSSSGQSINGNVKKVSGANLDVVVDIVTGLPVSDHDHGLTGLEYGDNGEIYIQCASNTNGGIPGRLTGKQVQKDNYYSSATVVAHLADPMFDGAIRYDALDDGIPIGGNGVEVFAAGTRNPFGICLHSNGNLYASDNGPNFSYGDMMTGCGPGEFKPDVTEGDKINLLKKGGYYGAPNRVRALTDNDPRQCVWRSQFDPSGNGYTAPILKTTSSTDGLIEFSSDHFNRQLRGNLIAAKYQGSLYRIVLAPDGKSVIPQSDPYIELTEDVDALDVTQAPDGTLISTSLDRNALYFHKPIEAPTTQLRVLSVFPQRGGQGGGNNLQIYGVNFNNPTTVTVGGRNCAVTSFLTTKIVCTMPGGTGTVDIVVEGGNKQSYTFQRGYRYVTGLPNTP